MRHVSIGGTCFLSLRWNRSGWHVSDLLYEELALVDKLLVIGAVFKEMGEEAEELVTVHEENLLDGDGLVGIGDEDFEDVEALVLDHLAVVTEKIHANFEVLATIDVICHDGIVGAVEEDLAEELDGLTLGHVAVGLDEDVVVLVEEELEVDRQIPGHQLLMPC
jgi:hypothetical protein